MAQPSVARRIKDETGEQSAVDAAGRVQGLDNVRVIDASVFPTIPTANLNAHTIMLAEKLTARLMAESESMAVSVRNRMQRPNNGVLCSTVPAGPR